MKSCRVNADKMFKAFADEARLRILYLLSKGEQCVCDLMDVLKMGQSKVSRHLSYLKKSGLVEPRKEGLWVYYSLTKPKSEFQKRLISCLECCLDNVPILIRDLKVLKIKNKNRVKPC
jgi:ArsR family transcriptional regulator